MKWVYKILRTLLVTMLILGVGIPCILYVALSMHQVQDYIKSRAQKELTTLLGTNVSIGHLDIVPFNQVRLSNVAVADPMQPDKTALNVKILGVGVDVWQLLKGDLVFTYAEIVELDGKLWRQTPDSPLNIQPVIDRLSPKDCNKPPTIFSLAINNIVIRNSEVSFDVLSMPITPSGKFNPHHIAIQDLMADISLPRLKNDTFDVDIRRMAMREISGFTLRNLSTIVKIRKQNLTVERLRIEMPGTLLDFDGKLYWPYQSIAQIADNRQMTPIHIALRNGAYVTLSDFSTFIPELARFTDVFNLALDVNGSANSIKINRLGVKSDGLDLEIAGNLDGMFQGAEQIKANVARLDVRASRNIIPKIAKECSLNVQDQLLAAVGDIELKAIGKFDSQQIVLDANITTAAGMIKVSGDYGIKPQNLTANVDAKDLQTDALGDFPISITNLAANIKVNNAGRRIEEASFDGTIGGLTYRGYTYSPIRAAVALANKTMDAEIDIQDPNIELHLNGKGNFTSDAQAMSANIDVKNFNPTVLKLSDKIKYIINGKIVADLQNPSHKLPTGYVNLTNLSFTPEIREKQTVYPGDIAITSTCTDGEYDLTIDSKIAHLDVKGNFKLSTLPNTLKWMAASAVPDLFPEKHQQRPDNDDRLTLKLNIPNEDNPVFEYLTLPVEPLVPINLSAEIDGTNGVGRMDVDIPYMRQGKKLIENTALSFNINALLRTSDLYTTTTFTAKGERVNLTIDNNSIDGHNDTEIAWQGERGRNHGHFRCSTSFKRDSTLITDIKVNPGEIVFADTVWTIAPSTINIRPNRINVDNFRVWRESQLLGINGTVSRYNSDKIILTLQDINLDYIFETLNISSNVMFGGDATGTIHASELFGKQPKAYTEDLYVKNLAYNNCVMGNGHIKSHLIPEYWGITIDAEIDQKNGHQSIINGLIKPMTEELDFKFQADRAPVGFLQPFMAAFCNKVTGEASGDAHLYGTFKLLDMQGKIIAHDVAMDIDFTGTTYHASDTVVINPGKIDLKDITLYDDFGHTAQLSGYLTHQSFHDPVFRFDISKARRFLCYDVKENNEHPWYGRIFGNGSASISGKPGIVEINVNMATAENSEFTFVLSDAEVAEEYTFLSFRDATPVSEKVIIQTQVDTIPDAVRKMRQKVEKLQEPERPTDYAMTFNVDITPQANIVLVMDPVGGDKIRAVGSGNMVMTYDRSSDDLKMYGTYTLDYGRYNFTLQDIIVKEFTIDQGSNIAFHGDPYNAQLDIRAYYQLNANLTDLDESFAQDRDLNRTNVPVRAMLYATGDMRSPELSFDISFPTLAPETSRKVRSIVSTDEMMSQQIIYLLALNRFYTPDYMTATRGNELVSVASSTLSSRLSSMLGELSDKFSISPTVRSDRGDFSDVEVDVALSSSLLNNRLFLNGTLGYRDNTLNTNQFIGDFDIEYLLNRQGTIRLKAYNRYNDRNYYLKTALTTQGVGVEFKREFDDMFAFLKARRNRKKNHDTPTSDTTTVRDDSIPLLIVRPANDASKGND